MTPDSSTTWTAADAAALYGTDHWGANYFGIAESGEMVVNAPCTSGVVQASLMEIARGIQARGYAMPVLLRIENLLDAQLKRLNESFQSAIDQSAYQGHYQGVFPIKVNQQAQVIEEIVNFGAKYGHGLEAGSKAELTLALAHLPEQSLLILNGTKDREYVDLGLWAQQLGYDVFFVIESPAEVPLLIERSQKVGIKPQIGLRMKVSAKVGGLWTETSGDRSSFGLSATQLLQVVDLLRAADLLGKLQLLHCHLGSQIPRLSDIEAGVHEAARVYNDLCRLGAPLTHIDLGGGLAVDYSGSHLSDLHSRDYSLDDYCHTLVGTLNKVLDPDRPHPQLITESGRFTVAHASMLLFNILDVQRFEPTALPEIESIDEALSGLAELIGRLDQLDPATAYSQALISREQLRQQYNDGSLSLTQRAQADDLFLAIAQRIVQRIDSLPELPTELQGLKESLSDIYYGNFSVFQSLPDTWAIDQIFPVVPLHRHTEQPTRAAIFADLTCDCDGKLDTFVTGTGECHTLPVHPLNEGEDYLLGVFMMGAYQETLGDLHNLFGDTHVISVRINEDGSHDVLKEISGDSIGDVLSYVEHDPQELLNRVRRRAETAVKQQRIDIRQRQQLLDDYSASLRGYTYFER